MHNEERRVFSKHYWDHRIHEDELARDEKYIQNCCRRKKLAKTDHL
jgi:hypothetical protein